MFGLGPTELIVILVLALLVLGPQRIPEAASSLGKAIRSFRRATRELRDQIDIDDDVRRPFEDLRSALRDEPAPLPPPTSGDAGGSALAAAGAATTSLVKPPAEPVVSQTGDGEPTASADANSEAKTEPVAVEGHRPPRGEPPLDGPIAPLASAPADPTVPSTKSDAASDGSPGAPR